MERGTSLRLSQSVDPQDGMRITENAEPSLELVVIGGGNEVATEDP